MRYLLDSNCFIEPHRTFCPTDVGLSCWNKIKCLSDNGTISSLDKVKEELVINEDALSAWIKVNIDKSFFFKFDTPATVLRLREIINWAQYDSFYSQKAKNKFLKMDKADIYLAAYASIDTVNRVIVSEEIPAPRNAGEIKLPDVCNRYGVRCIFLRDMFRELRETF